MISPPFSSVISILPRKYLLTLSTQGPCCGGKSSGSGRRRWLFDWLTSVAGGAAEREEEEGEQGGMNGLHRGFYSEICGPLD